MVWTILASQCLKVKIKEAKSKSGKAVVNLSGTLHFITKLTLADWGLTVKGLIYQGDSLGKRLSMKQKFCDFHKHILGICQLNNGLRILDKRLSYITL